MSVECGFNLEAARGYKSNSQIARVLTEGWVCRELYCPRCGNTHISHFPNNKAVADFFCPNCKNEYELKSKSGRVGKRIADGAYETFIERITGNSNPDFFVLSYDLREMCVDDLWVIPKHFFVPGIVEKRKPLSSAAKRAGWGGCNILLSEIPAQGRISIIKDRAAVEKKTVLAQVQKAARLETAEMEARGWLLDVLCCVNAIRNECFTLDEVYAFAGTLAERYPNNNNVRPKIRQQLQYLRDRGFLEFLGRGRYRKI